jgi:hypothetical protein
MKTTAYLRMSTDGQDIEKNKNDILSFANDRNLGRVHWLEETISGTVNWRKRKVAQIVDEAQEGDILIVSELSWLGRSMLEIIQPSKPSQAKACVPISFIHGRSSPVKIRSMPTSGRCIVSSLVCQ